MQVCALQHTLSRVEHNECLVASVNQHRALTRVLSSVQGFPLNCQRADSTTTIYRTFQKILQMSLQIVYIIACCIVYKMSPYITLSLTF